MLLGYARVSTDNQNLERQIDALVTYGVEERNIYQEKITGTKKDRQELNRLLKFAKEGDTVVVSELSRLARSTKQLYELMEIFEKSNINFVSLKENINTNSAVGKLIFNIFAGIAQFERDLIAERTKEGLQSAKKQGRVGGRPRADQEKIDLALIMYDSKKYTMKQIIEKTGLPRTTVYDYIRARKSQEQSI